MEFYEEKVPEIPPSKKYDIISNGKSFRDFQLLEKGVSSLGLKTLIIGKEDSDSKFIEYKVKADSVENVRLCSEAKAMCIAINSQNNGICGITSLNDALAFEIPVLISDNARLGFDVEQIGIGLVYKAGDLQSFEEKLKILASGAFISKTKSNIRKFRQENSYKEFSEFIAKIICEV
ncbi:MAG: hypothetical protein K2N31_00275 [Treponemataceae bacterium]|nr:hypothetical protein [Treponemataceae bacterium]